MPTEVVHLLGDLQRVGIELNDGIHARAILVQCLNTFEVIAGQFNRGERARRHHLLQFRHRGFIEIRRHLLR